MGDQRRFADRRVLVTGASRGIGAAIAQRPAAEGAHVAITARTLDTPTGLPGTLRQVADRPFIDSEAVLVFVDDPGDAPVDATPFDMRGVELSDRGRDCSFETILRHYLDDPVLWDIARIVHEADIADGRYEVPRRQSSTSSAAACP